MRQRVPSRPVLWAGHALAGLVLAWLATGWAGLGIACAAVGGLYSLASILVPAWMPTLDVDGLPRVPDGVVRWSHRILGAAGIPLWIAAWQNHAPQFPPGILMPVGIGVAVAIAAELMTGRRGQRSERP